MAEAGKGDKQRPTNYESFSKHFEEIFGARPSVTEAEFNNPPTPPQDEHTQAHRPVGSAPQS
jgi:hypothetical protein